MANETKDDLSCFKEAYEFICKNVSTGIVCANVDTHKVTCANPHFLKIAGYSQKTIAGKTLKELFNEQDLIRILKNIDSQKQIATFCVCGDQSKKSVVLKPFVLKSGNGKTREILIIVDTHSATEVDLQKKNELLAALTEINSKYISGVSIQQVFNDLLSVLIKLTESEFGFIGEVKYAPYGKPYLKVHSFVNIHWHPDTIKLYEEYVNYGLEFHNLDNLFGAVITSREVVISNNPDKDPRAKKSLPPGHPELKSFLGLPLRKGNSVVGVAGVANRSGGYSPDIIEYLTPFLSTSANLIEAARVESLKREAELALKKALEEKIVLLRELHHRVKNNFQVISSLLNIHLNRAKDEKTSKTIENIKNRIGAMAVVHEMLYKADELASVDMADYIKRITDNLLPSLRADSSRLKIELNIEHLRLGIDRAVALGMVLSELISNSILHGFPGKLSGKIYVELNSNPQGYLNLIVADTGVGLPEGFSIERLNSLGLNLCSQIIRKYNGQINFSQSPTYKTIVNITLLSN
ncbi:MAG: histidine kinase dimerization/phosphoacceptor domain -containing protein [Verrucomicrobiia bacterium]